MHLSIEWKIRQYMHGFLLLALAGVIIAMLESIIASIPDQQIVLHEATKATEAESNIIVIPNRESSAPAGSVIEIKPDRTSRVTSTLYFAEYAVYLRDPPLGYMYVIVFKYTSAISHVNIVNFDYNQYWRNELQVYNNYVYITWADSIAFIEIYTNNQAYTESVYIFVVRADTDIPFTLDFSRAARRPKFSEVRESFKNNTIIVLTPDVMWYPYGDYLTHTYYAIPRLANPPLGLKYVIVFKYVDWIEKVYIRDCNTYQMYYYYELWNYIHGDYVYLAWNSCILDFFVYAHAGAYAYNAYIFVVSQDTSVPFQFSESEIILRNQNQKQESDCAGFSLSSKTLLRFVSFTAITMIVVTALRKFDIEL
jgi:hypothetical protein